MISTTPATRIPLTTFAIAFGLVGLADAWTATAAALHLPAGIGDAFSVVAAIAWLWLLAAHTRRGRSTPGTLADQLRHPLQGPIAALAPIVGMLLGADLYHFSPLAGRIVVVAFMTVTAAFAGWLISRWLGGGLELEALHGGYFLPTVAGGFIAATAAADVGLDTLALGAFAAGAFFWVVMFSLITARLMFRSALPNPLVPTMAIFVAPPAVAGTAWFLIAPTPGPVDYALTGITVLMLLVQLALVPRYRNLPFSLGFWSFTFPFAAVAVYAIGWLEILRPTGWQALVVAIVTGISALVVGIAIKSLRLLTERTVIPPLQVVQNVDDHTPTLEIRTIDSLKVS